MHIIHALFTRTLGGLEQSYLDTMEAIVSKGYKVSALLRSDAPYRAAAGRYARDMYTVNPTGFYDLFAAWRVRRILKRLRPDMVLAHNARAIALVSMAARGTGIAVFGVSHSYKTARTVNANALIVLTKHMREHFVAAGYPESCISVIPNLIRLAGRPVLHQPQAPMVIGAMGRFTVEKGFDDLLKALHQLQQTGVAFKARIAGEGEEGEKLRAQAEQLGIAAHISWEGWVKDKAEFYSGLDVICVPSLQESFGLVVLEAQAHGVPVIATDTPGPASIIDDGVNGLLVPRGHPQAMANALHELALQPEKAVRLAEAGWDCVQQYGFDTIACKWDIVLSSSLLHQKCDPK